MKRILTLVAITGAMVAAGSASAYDGQKFKEPGNGWEAKPGFPEKIAGSKYDPKHDPVEIGKQQLAVNAMDERNAKRIANAKATGSFEFDVKKIK
ncbi:MAG: methanol dehydrogenase [Methylophilaceae bacterium]|nr:methanol dehydrogenase [Methylophilaceae bacterium]